MLDDRELVDRCLKGRQDAWNELVERYSRLVYSIPRRYGLRESDADEVSQATFVALFRSLERLRDHARLSSWLITTAHRESWRIGRAKGHHAELDAAIADVSSPAEEQVAEWERQHLVREALVQLGDPCSSLIAALFFDPQQPDYQTIADRLGMRVGSIGPTRTRCFKKLETILRRLGIHESGLSGPCKADAESFSDRG